MKRRRGDLQFLPSVDFVTHEKEITEAIERLDKVTADLNQLIREQSDDPQED